MIELKTREGRAQYAALSTLNGYPEIFSVFPGEPVHVRLARKPSLNPLGNLRTVTVKTIELVNVVTGAATAVPVPAKTKLRSQKPRNYRDEGADYAARVEIPTAGLEPGVYECKVTDSAGAKSKRIHFNVKPERRQDYDLLCVLPTFTWHAYNRIGGGCFYTDELGPVRTITTQRPMTLAGDNSIEASIPFLTLFAEAGAKVACIDSRDLHLDLAPQGRVPVMALLTHDEYWSEPMRAWIDHYVRRGGILMVIAGNVCWWKIEVEGDNLTVDKAVQPLQKGGGARRPRGRKWYQQGDPEERTFVASYRFGGYASERISKKGHLQRMKGLSEGDASFVDAGSLKIVRPDHPLFEGVALDDGDRLGGEVPIVYREIDAVPLKADGSLDRTWYDADKLDPEILATGTVIRGELFHSPVAEAGIVVEADIARGHVLHMGSFGWSRGLGQNNERARQVVLNAYRYCRGMAGGRRRRR
ncbi:MAG TPA: N,N-dimethylformamidase beta subunit family domain-containing protein [Rhizomicrobium sp.]|nr:N,N-dimethylformamidase beta subunit family domain-containing protein [Rhizomicrobium sp.]